MSNVNLRIGGRGFTVACADGEEAHIAALGRILEDKVQAAGGAGQTESRMLLFAALMLADEVSEARRAAASPPQPAAAPAADPHAAERVDPARLAAIADRLENLAQLLEGAARSA